MRILIVVPEQDRTSGNWVTARRFQQGLAKRGHHVALHGTRLHSGGLLRQQLLDFCPDITLLLHAYRTGKPWLESSTGLKLPCVVFLTGTDVNHGLDDPAEGKVIQSVLRQARIALLQNPLIAANLSASHPELAGNLRVLVPGITLGTADYSLRDRHALAKDRTLFLCPAGLRPVKGILGLLTMFDRVAAEGTTLQLAFCGPVLDENYGQSFLSEVAKRPWASYLGVIPQAAMANAMRGADVILNNSQSEGLANTLLEAAAIGIPILARNIPGNAAVVKHDINGLLYNNEEDLARFARQLLDPERRRNLSRSDPDRYNPDRESAELMTLLQEAVETAKRERISQF